MMSRSDRAMPIWDHIKELISRMKAVIITFIVSSLVALAVPVDMGFLTNASFYRTPSIVLLDVLYSLKPPDLELLAIGQPVTLLP